MSSDGHLAPAPALWITAQPIPSGVGFERHAHPRHQLAWTDAGALRVDTDDGTWILPPTRALWIPAHTAHRTAGVGATVLRGAYLEPASCPVDWPAPQPVDVGPLLAALLHHLAEASGLSPDQRARAEALVPDLLTPVATTAIQLTLPADARAREVAEGLLARPGDPRTLAAWGRDVGASPRTLRRGFTAATGLTFGRWRTAARVSAALPLLAAGRPVSAVADVVGFATASAFVAAFRRETGTTPGAYFTPPRADRAAAATPAGEDRVSTSRARR